MARLCLAILGGHLIADHFAYGMVLCTLAGIAIGFGAPLDV